MYTIVMDKNKNLNTTVRATLFKGENLSDKIQFLIPPRYDGNDGRQVIDEETGEITVIQDGVIELGDYIAVIKYVNPNGNFHSESLTMDTEKYKNYLRYTLPVDSNFSAVAGGVTIRLTFIKFEDETHFDKLETNSTTVYINKPNGFEDFVNFEDIEAYKKQLSNLQNSMPNDLAIDDKDKLHLTHDGETIGEGVEIVVPTIFDDLDSSNDGVIDVDDLKDDESIYQFIDVDT